MLFKRVTESAKAIPSQITGEGPNFSIANIKFPAGKTKLDEKAKKYLAGFASSLQQNFGDSPITLYIVGLAASEKTPEKNWTLSAQRAQTVADFIKQALPTESDHYIYSWGAGAGGQWAPAKDLQQQSQILIAILKPK